MVLWQYIQYRDKQQIPVMCGVMEMTSARREMLASFE